VSAEDRRSQIAEQVRRDGSAAIDALARQFRVTEQTIRRDVNALCDEGVLRRRHGGVTLPFQVDHPPGENLPYGQRQRLNLREKDVIARMVAAHVPDGASLAISVGTTPDLVAQALLHHRGLRIFTNNLSVALTCCANPDIQVTLCKGRVRPAYRDVVDPSVPDFFATYTVDFGVFGVGGIDSEGTLLDFAEEEVAARRAIAASCRTSLLVADHAKFGRDAIVAGGQVTDVDHLFTDRPPPPVLLDRLRARGVTLHLPQPTAREATR
jgi:DeoR family glycerol-3-phosphate regulon repressor